MAGEAVVVMTALTFIVQLLGADTKAAGSRSAKLTTGAKSEFRDLRLDL